MSTALTIAAALVAWFVLGCIVALLIGRALPASPEQDEHESGDIHTEFDGRIAAQVRAVNDFHSGSNLTTREQHHV